MEMKGRGLIMALPILVGHLEILNGPAGGIWLLYPAVNFSEFGYSIYVVLRIG